MPQICDIFVPDTGVEPAEKTVLGTATPSARQIGHLQREELCPPNRITYHLFVGFSCLPHIELSPEP